MEEQSSVSLFSLVKEYGAVALLIFALFCWYTFPLISEFDTAILGEGDIGIFYWNLHNFKASLAEGQSFTYTDWQEYPFGVDLTFHANTHLLCFLSLLFDNNTIAYNLFYLIHFLLGGLGAYALVKDMAHSRLPALFGAILFGYCNYMMLHVLGGHVNLISVGFVPFFFLWFRKTFSFEEGRWMPKFGGWKPLIILGIFFLLNFLSDYVVTFSVLFGASFFFISHWLILWLRRYAWWKIAIGLVVLVLGAHQLIYTMRYTWHFNDGTGFYFGADVLWYFIPNQNRIYDSTVINEAVSTYMPNSIVEGSTFMGLITLVLFGLSLFLKFKQRIAFTHSQRMLSITLVLIFLITLPAIKIAGEKLLYSPTSIIHFLPVLNNYRSPARISMLLSLFLPIWMAFIFTKSSIQWKRGLWASAVLVLMFELWPKPLPMEYPGKPPAYYETLARQPGEGGLFIPFGLRDGKRGYGAFLEYDHLLYSEVHQKKNMGGYISRIPDETYEKYTDSPVLQSVVNLQKGEPGVLMTKKDRDTFLEEFKPHFIFVRPPYDSQEILNYIHENFDDRITKTVESEGAYIFLLDNL